jgi:hypothetical protein
MKELALDRLFKTKKINCGEISRSASDGFSNNWNHFKNSKNCPTQVETMKP